MQKKVCMLGSFAVGKTSLVRRYVDSVFNEKYSTSIGVKIDRKMVCVDNAEISILLWDVYGEDNYQAVLPAYLRGMAGYILVVDPTRPVTFDRALSINKLVLDTLGPKPFILVLNKCDLKRQWKSRGNRIQSLSDSSFATIETSAKNNIGVNEMFEALVARFAQTTRPTH